MGPKTKKQLRAVHDQIKWIEDHGGDLQGYKAKVGDYGDGYKAIYEADMEGLSRVAARLYHVIQYLPYEDREPCFEALEKVEEIRDRME